MQKEINPLSMGSLAEAPDNCPGTPGHNPQAINQKPHDSRLFWWQITHGRARHDRDPIGRFKNTYR